MNTRMVKLLIYKDWYFGRRLIAGIIAAGIAALAARFVLGQMAGVAAQIVSVVLFFGVLNALMWLPMTTVAAERTAQNLALVMSLPITIHEYTAAKIVSSLSLFVVPWIVLGVSVIGYTLANDALSDAYIPITLVLLSQLLTLFCLMLGVALVSESSGAAPVIGVVCNVLFWFSLAFLGVVPGMGLVQDPELVWRTTARWMLYGQLAAVPVLLVATFVLQSRKKDFI